VITVRFTLSHLLAAALAIFVTFGQGSAFASDANDVVSHVQELIQHFNKGEALSADMADTLQVIDDFPPFFWNGKNALAEWGKAFGIETERRSIVKTSMTLGKATLVDVRDDHAYVVVSATCFFTHRNGRHDQERGTLTLALTKTDQMWKVSAITWSKGSF
jgi:ketosteroid isomerase-like protein